MAKRRQGWDAIGDGVMADIKHRREQEATPPWLLAKIRENAATFRAGAIKWGPSKFGRWFQYGASPSVTEDKVPAYFRRPRAEDMAEVDRIDGEIVKLQQERRALVQRAWKRAEPLTAADLEEASGHKESRDG